MLTSAHFDFVQQYYKSSAVIYIRHIIMCTGASPWLSSYTHTHLLTKLNILLHYVITHTLEGGTQWKYFSYSNIKNTQYMCSRSKLNKNLILIRKKINVELKKKTLCICAKYIWIYCSFPAIKITITTPF